MINKIFKDSLTISAMILVCACSQKYPAVFETISMLEAAPDKVGFLPFQMFFPKNENPYVQYIKDGNPNEKIEISYSRKEKDESDNSIIYFFTDDWSSEYQIRVDDRENIIRMRFVSKK